ncbi:MAG TPA: sortase [Euzebyales bacterium]|nr:sortase [Euzebyales bacterium]
MLAGAITAAILAAVIAAVVTLLGARGGPPSDAAEVAPTPSPVASPAVPSPRPERTEPAPTAEPSRKAAPKITTRSARLEDVVTDQVTPTSLDIDAIGIDDAPVDAVGVESDGSMEIPVDVSRIGWYEYGPAPGDETGSAVLTAHIDSRTQGRGVFYDLDAVEAGDTVGVGMSDGTTRTFVVDEIRQIPKVDLPTGDIFRRDGRARLALITCGGTFDPSSRHYLDNLVVLATPTG